MCIYVCFLYTSPAEDNICMCVAAVLVQVFFSPEVTWMGGDGPDLRYELHSDSCERFKVQLNDCAKYAAKLYKHMERTGLSLEDL